MTTYYDELHIAPSATIEEIAEAYQYQRQRYDSAQVAALDDDFRRISAERLAALDRMYAVLSDPARRRMYDASFAAITPKAKSSSLGRRELTMMIGGALLGVVLIALVWVLGGKTVQPDLAVADVNRPAPAFALPNLDGQTIQLADYRGKVVMVNFWYTGCAPCQEETPALQATYQRLRDKGLVVVGVNVRQNERAGVTGDNDIRTFITRYGVTYPIALDLAGDTARSFQVVPLPTSFFVDQNGTIRYASFSSVTAEQVEHIFTDLQRTALTQR